MGEVNEVRTAAYHEGGHAAVGLFLGHAPAVVEIDDYGGGFCRFTSDLTGPASLLIGSAGGIACEQFLGIVDTESEADAELARDQWQTLFARGRRSQVVPAVYSEVWSMVWSLEQPIRTLAKRLEQRRRLTADDLGTLCRREQTLLQFRSLFPKPKPQPKAASRPAPRRQTVTPPPPLSGRHRSHQSFAERMLAKAMAGGRCSIIGMPMGEFFRPR